MSVHTIERSTLETPVPNRDRRSTSKLPIQDPRLSLIARGVCNASTTIFVGDLTYEASNDQTRLCEISATLKETLAQYKNLQLALTWLAFSDPLPLHRFTIESVAESYLQDPTASPMNLEMASQVVKTINPQGPVSVTNHNRNTGPNRPRLMQRLLKQ